MNIMNVVRMSDMAKVDVGNVIEVFLNCREHVTHLICYLQE